MSIPPVRKPPGKRESARAFSHTLIQWLATAMENAHTKWMPVREVGTFFAT
jgi:hypothetical protein